MTAHMSYPVRPSKPNPETNIAQLTMPVPYFSHFLSLVHLLHLYTVHLSLVSLRLFNLAPCLHLLRWYFQSRYLWSLTITDGINVRNLQYAILLYSLHLSHFGLIGIPNPGGCQQYRVETIDLLVQ